MVTPKARGQKFEYSTAYTFEHFGFAWDRSGSSLGVDLKISKGGRLRYLVSCKKTSGFGPIYVPRREVERLQAASKETWAEGLLCFGFHRTPPLALPVGGAISLESTKHSYKIHLPDGKPLKEFLARAKKNVGIGSR